MLQNKLFFKKRKVIKMTSQSKDSFGTTSNGHTRRHVGIDIDHLLHL